MVTSLEYARLEVTFMAFVIKKNSLHIKPELLHSCETSHMFCILLCHCYVNVPISHNSFIL
jgi:hypothetical protein